MSLDVRTQAKLLIEAINESYRSTLNQALDQNITRTEAEVLAQQACLMTNQNFLRGKKATDQLTISITVSQIMREQKNNRVLKRDIHDVSLDL
jgi:hypothetical protein